MVETHFLPTQGKSTRRAGNLSNGTKVLLVLACSIKKMNNSTGAGTESSGLWRPLRKDEQYNRGTGLRLSSTFHTYL